MAFIALPSMVMYPRYGADNSSAGSKRQQKINGATHKIAWIVKAPQAGTLDYIAFNTVSAAQCTNGLKVSIQGVGTNEPDGTPTHYRNVPFADLGTNQTVVTGLITDDGTDTGAKKTFTIGEVFAVVIEFDSFAAGDDVVILWSWDLNGHSARTHADYALIDITGSYVRQTIFQTLQLGFNLNGIGWIHKEAFGVYDPTFSGLYAYDSADSPDEIGIKFTLPVPMRCTGINWTGAMAAAGSGLTVTLYDASDTVLAQTVESEVQAMGVDSGIGPKNVYWSGVELSKDTTYRVAIAATDPVNTVSLYSTKFQTSVAAGLVNTQAWGDDAVKTSRADAGAWTDTTAEIPQISLLIDAIDPVKASALSSVQQFFAPVFNRRHR